MPTEKSVAENGSRSIPASPEAEAVIPLGNADKPQTGIPSEPSTPSGHKPTSKRRLIMGAAAVLGLAIAVVFGIPWIKLMLTTVSTDDAYVNGHVTFVAARVPGQVSRVLVDDNNRVHQGDLLAELDPEPYEVIVAVKKAAVDTAKADLAAAKANVRGVEARASSQRWKFQHAMEDVENQIALLHSKVAALDKSRATLTLAEAEFSRTKKLVASAVASREEYDRREAALSVARAEVIQALDDIHQIRVSLGLPAEPENGGDLGQVPPDLDQTFSAVRQAQSELIQSAAELGVIHSYNQTPKQMLEEFYKRDAQGDINKIFAALVPEAPAVKQAEAKLQSAERDLDQAELNLRYCKIIAEIDGVVTRRNVNPGNNVLAGQGLMAIRSLDRNLDRRQFQGDTTERSAYRPGGRPLCRRVRRPARLLRPDHRFYVRHRVDISAAPAPECDGQFRQSGATIAGAHRASKLRPKQGSSVHRPFGCPLRLS